MDLKSEFVNNLETIFNVLKVKPQKLKISN